MVSTTGKKKENYLSLNPNSDSWDPVRFDLFVLIIYKR